MVSNKGLPAVPTAFPELPQTTGLMRPCRFEGETRFLEIVGEIPADIDGTFYRVMPDPQFPAFVENDPVSLPRRLLNIQSDTDDLDSVVQWRRKRELLPHQEWKGTFQAEICAY